MVRGNSAAVQLEGRQPDQAYFFVETCFAPIGCLHALVALGCEASRPGLAAMVGVPMVEGLA